MASLHKDPRGRSPFWYCSFQNEQGKWSLKSTKEKNRAEAQRVCDCWDREAKALRDAQKIENKEQVLETLIALTRKAGRGEFNEAIARDALDALLKATGQASMRHVTAEAFLKDWASQKSLSNAPKTAERYQQTVRDFIKFLGEAASLSLSAVTPKHVEAFRDLQLTQGKSAITANLVVKALRIPFNVARKQGLIHTNPADTVATLRAESRKRKPFTVEQVKTLVRTADWEWRGMILLGFYYGIRIQDAARITWTNFDTVKRTIRYKPSKTASHGTSVENPLAPDVERFLAEWPGHGDNPKAPLFPSLYKLGTGGRNGLSRKFIELMHAAGIDSEEDEQETKGKGRHFRAISFHSLRHTCVSIMANSGVVKELRVKVTGHTTDEHDRYTHIELDTLRKAQEALPSLLGAVK
jgi:integrase